MKTRGKTKVENPDYLGGDLLDDGENTNGYTDEKVDDVNTFNFFVFYLNNFQ